jgi:hypothetical protein
MSRFSLHKKKENEDSPEENIRSSISFVKMKDLDSKVDKPVKFGMLHKDGGFQKKSWDKRYFVLYSDGTLEYYKNATVPKDATQLADLSKAEFKGSLNVTECAIRSGKPRARKDNVLELDTTERVFFIAFDSVIEMVSWESGMRQIGCNSKFF